MASSAQTQPVLRKVDISANPTVLTVATTLRRLWLVDPSSPVLAEQLAKLQEEGGHEHDHDHDHSNCDGHDHDHDHDHEHSHAHEADLGKDEHDHANCGGHDHDHDHDHGEEEEDDDESACGCGHDHDEEDSEQHQIFPIALQSIANQIDEAANPDDDAYDDDKWKASTDLVLIEPPAGLASPFAETEDGGKKEGDDEDEDETISSPLFTPFRQQVYGIYNHVFYDAYSSLKAELGGDSAAAKEIGEFEPPATTVMVLEAPAPDDPEKGIPHEFETDTFVYPVWVAKGTRLVVKEEEKEEEMLRFGDDGKRWTEVVWFRAGSKVVVYPESDGDSANFKGVVALLALGVCEPVGGAGEGADADVE